MAPTPYTPNGRLNITYKVGGLDHEWQIPVNIASEAGNASTIVDNQFAHVPLTILEAGDILWTPVANFYPVAVVAPLATLYKRDVNIFIPLGSVALSIGGQSAVAYKPASQLTFTFRDVTQHEFKVVLLETIYAPPEHGNPLVGTFATFVGGFVTPTAGDEPHDFVRSRADEAIDRVLFYTLSLNRKLRRARGLAG